MGDRRQASKSSRYHQDEYRKTTLPSTVKLRDISLMRCATDRCYTSTQNTCTQLVESHHRTFSNTHRCLRIVGLTLLTGQQWSRHSYPGQLSLAIPPCVCAVNTSESRDVKEHTVLCTSGVSVA